MEPDRLGHVGYDHHCQLEQRHRRRDSLPGRRHRPFLQQDQRPSTITVGSGVVVGTLDISNSTNSYNITGTNTLTMDNNTPGAPQGSCAQILSAGTHTISVPLALNSSLFVNVSSGSLTMSSVIANGTANGITTNSSFTKTGSGTLTISGASSNTYTGTSYFTGGYTYLAKTGGALAVPGDFAIIDGSGTAYVYLNGNNEISTTANFSSLTPAYYGYFYLNGYSQTLASITSDTYCYIYNGGAANSTLTVNNNVNCTFNGRLTTGGTGTGTLGLVKGGSGTLVLTSSSSNYTGGTTVNGGVLQIGDGVTYNGRSARQCHRQLRRLDYLQYGQRFGHLCRSDFRRRQCQQARAWQTRLHRRQHLYRRHQHHQF